VKEKLHFTTLKFVKTKDSKMLKNQIKIYEFFWHSVFGKRSKVDKGIRYNLALKARKRNYGL